MHCAATLAWASGRDRLGFLPTSAGNSARGQHACSNATEHNHEPTSHKTLPSLPYARTCSNLPAMVNMLQACMPVPHAPRKRAAEVAAEEQAKASGAAKKRGKANGRKKQV
eukprot:365087-Chlamydomonas_euryale.AAC.17